MTALRLMNLCLTALHLTVLHLMDSRSMDLLSFRYFHPLPDRYHRKLPAEFHLPFQYRPYLLPQQNHPPASADCLPSGHPLPTYPLSALPVPRQSAPAVLPVAVLLSPVPLSADHQKSQVVSHLPFLRPQLPYPQCYLHCPGDRWCSPHQLSDLLLFLRKHPLSAPQHQPLHQKLLSVCRYNLFLLFR